ncbi:MAG: glycosyltransferase family 4 protein [Acidobacteria bacterium]|nr:glycosyltransferase family 4 protein [Acidobacteriota bacterium]
MTRALALISGLPTAGAEKVTVGFLRRLHGTEHRVSICTVTSRHDGPLAKEIEASGVVRHDLGACRLADPLALVRLLRLLRYEQPDIIHAHGQDASILGATARLVSPHPLIITRHVLDEPQGNIRQKCRAQMTLLALRRADSVIAVSKAAAHRLSDIAGLPRPKIRIIPNGIDLEPFVASDLPARGRQLREKLRLSPNAFVVLMPAALREGKGHEVALAAMPRLKEMIPGLRLLFAGSGACEFALKQQAKPFGDRVLFLGDFSEMPILLSACDLVILPSMSEALPTVLIEAAAAGRAVVATRVGGTPEVVKENCTGLLVPPNDPDALAAAVGDLANNPKQLKAFSEAARAHARENFSLELQVRRTLELWSEIMDRRAR